FQQNAADTSRAGSRVLVLVALGADCLPAGCAATGAVCGNIGFDDGPRGRPGVQAEVVRRSQSRIAESVLHRCRPLEPLPGELVPGARTGRILVAYEQQGLPGRCANAERRCRAARRRSDGTKALADHAVVGTVRSEA